MTPVTSGLRLDELAREIPGAVDVVGDASVRVVGVRHDSRAVKPGDLFVARKGAKADGARFVRDALARGAVAVLAARGEIDALLPEVPLLLVDDAPRALAFAAAAVYGHPAFSLEVVGVTGTNGKTTTAHLVRHAVNSALGEVVCGVIGTTGSEFGDFAQAGAHTTPESDEIARLMAEMRARGATHVAMEVSSHALALERVRAVRFRVAAFTNLTQDHLDFHGTTEAYGEAKARLFTECAPGSAVVNVDDPFGRVLAARVRAPLVRVSARVEASDEEADVAPRSATLSARGIEAVFRTPGDDVEVRAPRLVGAHNLENVAVALGVACALELEVPRAAASFATAEGAPGRLERCDTSEDDVRVFVDYAHTPDALARVLDSVRGITDGRVLCVFGAGGDRDPTKRGPMGEAVARRADVLFVTNDNPRNESAEAIADAIVRGAREAGKREIIVELDRRRAIDLAIEVARAGDVVVIAGKGHEDYQIVGAEKRPFDDRVEAKRALAARRA
jgi:UDP-N-acetylmuramoyl-L-alanyl-D-glutamate--2,6-diaminopimelate ligase